MSRDWLFKNGGARGHYSKKCKSCALWKRLLTIYWDHWSLMFLVSYIHLCIFHSQCVKIMYWRVTDFRGSKTFWACWQTCWQTVLHLSSRSRSRPTCGWRSRNHVRVKVALIILAFIMCSEKIHVIKNTLTVGYLKQSKPWTRCWNPLEKPATRGLSLSGAINERHDERYLVTNFKWQ